MDSEREKGLMMKAPTSCLLGKRQNLSRWWEYLVFLSVLSLEFFGHIFICSNQHFSYFAQKGGGGQKTSCIIIFFN